MSFWASLALFYAGWWACLLGAARDHVWVGPAVVAVVVVLRLLLTDDRLAEIRLLLLAIPIGLVADTALSQADLVRWRTEGFLPPPWLPALWANLAVAMRGWLSFVAGKPGWACALGVGSGPAAYAGGVWLGAIQFGPNPWLSLAALAVVWGIALPLLAIEAAKRPAAATAG